MPRTFVVKEDTTLDQLGGTLLDARSRGTRLETAMQELTALNPHADPAKVPAGTVLLVPDTPGFKPTAGTSVQSGALHDLQALLATALAGAAQGARTGLATRAAGRTEVATAMQTEEFKRLAGNDPELARQAEAAQAALATQEKEEGEAEQAFAGIGKAATEALAQLAKQLG